MKKYAVSGIVDNHPWTDDGYEHDGKLLSDFQPDERAALVAWIKNNIRPRRTVNKTYTSYGLKHIAERDLNLYISNNQFKDAMLQCGFYPDDEWETNWHYRIDNHSPCFEKK